MPAQESFWFKQPKSRTGSRCAGLVPSHPTALLNQDWRSSVRSPGSQPRDLFTVKASSELSLFVGCMAMDSC